MALQPLQLIHFPYLFQEKLSVFQCYVMLGKKCYLLIHSILSGQTSIYCFRFLSAQLYVRGKKFVTNGIMKYLPKQIFTKINILKAI
jgi:hypothetical protein